MAISKTLKIRKIGSYAVLGFPIRLLLDLKLIGCSLVVSQTPEGVLLKPVRRRHSFEPPDLLADSIAPTHAQSEALDAKLAAFDPKSHGGEAMALIPAGREAL